MSGSSFEAWNVNEKRPKQQQQEEERVDPVNATVRLLAPNCATWLVPSPIRLSLQCATPDAAHRSDLARRRQLARHIAHARRRVLEAVVPLKVRRSAELSSQLLLTLPAGARVHVLETRRTQDGGERVHVMDAARAAAASSSSSNGAESTSAGTGAEQDATSPSAISEDPSPCDRALGWVTARRGRLGESLLRELRPFDSAATAIATHSLRPSPDSTQHRAWPPPSHREWQASERSSSRRAPGAWPARPPETTLGWPLVFFSSSTWDGSASSAGAIDGRMHSTLGAVPGGGRVADIKSAGTRLRGRRKRQAEASTRIDPLSTRGVRGGTVDPSLPEETQDGPQASGPHGPAHGSPSNACGRSVVVLASSSAAACLGAQVMRLPSQTGAVKAEPRASRLYSVPGSGLSAKSSHVAVAAAVDEMLALYPREQSARSPRCGAAGRG